MNFFFTALVFILPFSVANGATDCQGKIIGNWDFDKKPRFMNLTVVPVRDNPKSVLIMIEHKRGSSSIQGTCEAGAEGETVILRWPEAEIKINKNGKAAGTVSEFPFEGSFELERNGRKKLYFLPYTPFTFSPDFGNQRPDLFEMARGLVSSVTDRRWSFSSILPKYVKAKFGGNPQTQIMMDQKIVAFLKDVRTAAKNHLQSYEAGSEELFNVFDPYNPPFQEMSRIDRALEVSTAAWLGNPSGRAFFAATATGNSLRRIFSKIRRVPGASVGVQGLSGEERETLAIFIGSTLWRIRGAGFVGIVKDSSNKRRYFVEDGFQSIGTLIGKDISPIASDFRWRLQLRGWGRYFDMGNAAGPESEAGKDETYDLIKMTDRGLYQVSGSLNQIEAMGGIPENLKIAGLHMGPCYLYAWREFIGLSDGSSEDPRYSVPPSEEESRRRFPWFVNLIPSFPTPVGELCTGAALGLGIVRALGH